MKTLKPTLNYNTFPFNVFFYSMIILPIISIITYYTTHSYYHRFYIPFMIFTAMSVVVMSISRGYRLRIPAYLLVYTLFIVYYVIRVYTNILGAGAALNDVGASVDSKTLSVILRDFQIRSFLLIFITETITPSIKQIHIMVRLLVLLFLFGVFVSIVQTAVDRHFLAANLSQSDDAISVSTYDARLVSIFGWISIQELGFSIPMVLVSVLPLINKKKRMFLVYVLSGFLMILISKFRYAMVGGVLSLLLSSFSTRQRYINVFRYSIILIIAIIVSIYVVNAVGLDFNKLLHQRLESKSYESRILAVSVFAEFFPKNLWLGSGGVVTSDVKEALAERSSHIHVGWLSLFYYYGLVGGVLFVIFFILFMRNAYLVGKKSGYWSPFYVLVLFAVNNCTLSIHNLFLLGIFVMMVMKAYMQKTLDDETTDPLTQIPKAQDYNN